MKILYKMVHNFLFLFFILIAYIYTCNELVNSCYIYSINSIILNIIILSLHVVNVLNLYQYISTHYLTKRLKLL